ncbi:MAG: response regulator transcription factor [Bacteroidia bacterium]|nr:response regulator transcription factor [Bacteroidia bacterium]
MKIIIGDDHELISSGIIAHFQSQGRSDEFASAKDKTELLYLLEQQAFEVIILDVQFGVDDARQIMQAVTQRAPNIQKIALSSFEDEITVKSVLAAGFQAYVSKRAPLAELIAAVDHVGAGQQYISQELKKKLFASLFSKDAFAGQITLTRREKEVLEQIQAGLSTKEMAEKLSISEKTVETYRSSLLLKFQVKNVASLVRESILKGFVFPS